MNLRPNMGPNRFCRNPGIGSLDCCYRKTVESIGIRICHLFRQILPDDWVFVHIKASSDLKCPNGAIVRCLFEIKARQIRKKNVSTPEKILKKSNRECGCSRPIAIRRILGRFLLDNTVGVAINEFFTRSYRNDWIVHVFAFRQLSIPCPRPFHFQPERSEKQAHESRCQQVDVHIGGRRPFCSRWRPHFYRWIHHQPQSHGGGV